MQPPNEDNDSTTSSSFRDSNPGNGERVFSPLKPAHRFCDSPNFLFLSFPLVIRARHKANH